MYETLSGSILYKGIASCIEEEPQRTKKDHQRLFRAVIDPKDFTEENTVVCGTVTIKGEEIAYYSQKFNLDLALDGEAIEYKNSEGKWASAALVSGSSEKVVLVPRPGVTVVISEFKKLRMRKHIRQERNDDEF